MITSYVNNCLAGLKSRQGFFQSIKNTRDFPGSPVVRTPCGPRFNPCSGTKIIANYVVKKKKKKNFIVNLGMFSFIGNMFLVFGNI